MNFIARREIIVLLPFCTACFWALFAGERSILNMFHSSSEGELYFNLYYHLSSGQVPFADFFIEYPPLSVYFIVFPWFFIKGLSLETFMSLYLISIGLWLSAFLYLARKLLTLLSVQQAVINRILLLTFAGLVILAYSAFARYDVIPAVFVSSALLLYLYYQRSMALKHFILAIALLSVAISIKVYPLVFLPVIFIYEATQKRFANLLTMALVTGVLLSINIPFFIYGETYFLKFLDYQGGRDIQIESLYASLWFLGEKLFLLDPAEIMAQNGALEIINHKARKIARYALPLTSLLLILNYLFFTLLIFLSRKKELFIPLLCRCFVCTLLIFLLFNKVFSPQYLVWLVTLFPLFFFFGDMKRSISLALLFSCFLTLLIYPFFYGDLILKETMAVVLLAMRNFLLLGGLLYLVFSSVKSIQKTDSPAAVVMEENYI